MRRQFFWAIHQTYSIENMKQTFLIMALPVLLASFTVCPWAAFPFMIFAIGFYTFIYFYFGRLFQYDFSASNGFCGYLLNILGYIFLAHGSKKCVAPLASALCL